MGTVKLPFYARLALILLSVMLIIIFLMKGSDIFIPMVFALLISVLLLPFAKFMERRLHLGRGTASILAVIIFVALISGFFFLLIQQAVSFSQDFPQLETKVQKMLADTQKWIAADFHVNTKQQTDYINKSASSVLATVANSLGNIFMSISGMVLWVVFILIYTFFMLYHRRLLLRFILHLFKPEHRAQVNEVVTETRGMINGYVVGLLIEMLIVSVIGCTMFLIMGIKYAILLGLMAAVLNIIPYLGIYTSLAITMLVTFANSGPSAALEAAIGMFVVHLIDSNVMMPRIVGSRVNMNPFITIVAVLVGHFIWGIPGMFLFIPVTAIIKIISSRVDGLQAWAILIGTEDKPKQAAPKVKISDD